MRILGVIPAFNEAGTVGLVVSGALRHLADVLVVDDGSTDDTVQKAKAAGAKVVSHAGNLGKGAAIKTGFDYAMKEGFDAVVTLDADTQHDPDEIPKLIDAASGGAGIVIGSRLKDKEKIPKARYYTNMVGVGCISWRSKNRLLDSQSGFRLYRADVIRGMKFSGGRFETETELLIRAGLRGFKIASVPVRTIYSEEITGRSHFRAVYDTYRICIVFLKSFFWFNP